MRSTGRCAPGWKPSTSRTCWRLPATTGSLPEPGGPSAPASWLPACRGGPGSGWQPGGAKGQRWYDWAWVTVSDPGPGHRHLLIRRNRRTGELAFYRCYSPHPVTLAALVKAAGLRWTVEVGHPWHRSSCAGFSWLRSLLAVGFLFGRCPAGAGVEAGGAGSALA